MPDRERLRRDLEELCAIERPTASPGERAAALWVAHALRDAGARDVRVEQEGVHGTYWWPVGLLSAAGVLGGLLSLRGRRGAGALLAAAAAAGLVDDIGGGRRHVRRRLRRRTCWNVVAQAGDPDGARTLVVLAHHDAPRTGLVFDGRPQRWVWERAPRLIERADTSVPMWWPVVGGPLAIALGSLLGSRPAVEVGTGVSAVTIGLMADIARSETVPAANDNGSGVVALLALARALRDDPPRGVRVLLVSAGAEESLQDGIRAWCARHLRALDRATTTFLNLETVGSPELALLEGEGTLRMEDYDAGWREQVAAAAARAGISLRRGLRTRLSTDSLIPHRAGYRTATLVSVEAWKAPSHYHWPTDVPANVTLETVAAAVRVADAVARSLQPSERASATASSAVEISPA